MIGEVVWDGTKNGPGGALLGDYSVPGAPAPRQWLVLAPDEVAAEQSVRSTAAKRAWARRPVERRFVPNRKLGPVFHARPAIWAMLAAPVAMDDIERTIHGLPRHALKSAVSLLVAGGAVVHAGRRENLPPFKPGEKSKTLLYQRAPAYQTVASWPVLPRVRRAK